MLQPDANMREHKNNIVKNTKFFSRNRAKKGGRTLDPSLENKRKLFKNVSQDIKRKSKVQ
jgi:hypothetical protein